MEKVNTGMCTMLQPFLQVILVYVGVLRMVYLLKFCKKSQNGVYKSKVIPNTQ